MERTATPLGAAALHSCLLTMLSVVATDTAVGEWLRPESPPTMNTLLGGGWRHDSEWVLTRNAHGHLVVFDPQGQRHEFAPDAFQDHRFVPIINDAVHPVDVSDAVDEAITLEAGLLTWRQSDGSILSFDGSLPVRQVLANGVTREFEYESGRLVRVLENGSLKQEFLYRHGVLAGTRDADGVRHPLPEVASGTCTNDEASRCDSEANPPDAAFQRGPSIPFAMTLDIRPASCDSFFLAYAGTDRGLEIESALAHVPPYRDMTATLRIFPSVDFIAEDRLVLSVSRDLASASFDPATNPDALLEAILDDAEHWRKYIAEPLSRGESVTASELGASTTLEAIGNRTVELHLVIRHGMALPGQVVQMATAGERLAADYGIVLKVIEIP